MPARDRIPALLVAAAIAVAVLAFAVPRCGSEHAPAMVASWARTPGVLNPDVTQATLATTVCRSGYSRTIRPPSEYTDALKRRQIREWRLPGGPRDYQEDHLISLSLGGHPTDPRNLWPEPHPRAEQVDRIEIDLHEKLCDGALTLREVQERESRLKHEKG